MSSTMKVVIASIIGLMLLIGGSIGYVVSAKFTAEKFEQAIYAQDESMQNTWGMMEGLLKSQGFTVKNYGEVFIKTLEANAKRYENKPNQLMQWVQESKSQMSDKAHLQLMKTVEKVYTKKEARQLSKISYVQEYRIWRKATIKGALAVAVFDMPSKEVAIIEKRIISTKQVKEVWKSGEEPETKLF